MKTGRIERTTARNGDRVRVERRTRWQAGNGSQGTRNEFHLCAIERARSRSRIERDKNRGGGQSKKGGDLASLVESKREEKFAESGKKRTTRGKMVENCERAVY